MKKLAILLVVAGFSLTACTQSTGKGDDTSAREELNNKIAENSAEPGTIHLTKAEFLDKVMNYEKNPETWKFEGDKPCIVDFYADWCGPCKITSPILEEFAVEYHGKINIYKVDTDEEKELAAAFGIRSIPSFLYCPEEGQPTMTAGIARTKEETKEMFRKQIEEILLSNGE